MNLECAYYARSSSKKCAHYAQDIAVQAVHKAHMDLDWFRDKKRELKLTDAVIGTALGRDRSIANRLMAGKLPFDVKYADGLAKAFQVSRATILHRAGITDAPREEDLKQQRPDAQPTRTADGGEAVAILRLDLTYSMGPGTNLDDSFVEEEPVLFDLGFLRSLTRSDPSQLRVVEGVGDSMQPTIHDREPLIIDVGQKMLNMQDRIWAISLFGAGALKRLRTVGKERVLVISDNPDVPDQEVDAADLYIAGRLLASIKRH